MPPVAGPEYHTRQPRVSSVIQTQRLLRVALWSILLAAATYTSTDPDLWGNVRFGLDILRDASIPHVDPYSFTADHAWINHEWLSEVITAGAFRLGGNLGLILLKLAAIGGMLLFLNSTLRREGVDAAIVRDGVAAVAVILTMEQTQHVRPQLFSLVCFAALLWCLMAARRGSPRSLLFLPPLFAVWANLHGGWLVGGGVLALWTLGVAISGDRRQTAWCLAVGVASLCSTLLTPYGLDLWIFLRDTVGFSRADVVEWQPVYVLGSDTFIRWSLTFGLGVLAVVRVGRADRQPQRMVALLALAAASFMVTRLEAFFALAILFLVGAGIGRARQRLRVETTAPQRAASHRGMAAIALGVTAAALVVIETNIAHLRVDPRFTPGPGAVAFLNTQPPGGRVLVWFDWSEYGIWHLSPRMRVSIDGRRETVYSPSLQDRHLRFYFDAPGGSTLPHDLAADYIWIPRTLPAVRRVAEDGWQRLYEDDQSVVFGSTVPQRSNVPVTITAVAQTRVFPGP